MNTTWINTFIGFVVLLLLQIFVFSQMDLGVYGSIYAYVMFILLLSVDFSALSVLLLSAAMGISIDIFSSDTLGLHLAACSVIGYLRPFVLKRITSPSDTQMELPVIEQSPFREYIGYTGILVLIHHLVLFLLEAFNFTQIPFILFRTLVSSVLSIVVISLLSLLVRKRI